MKPNSIWRLVYEMCPDISIVRLLDVPIKSFEALKKGTPLLTQFSLLSLSVENTW